MQKEGSGALERVVIVGAGHAGTAAAMQLRNLGHAGPIDLVSEESEGPYHRPPLSKAWLLGKTNTAAIAFKSPEFYAENAITLHLGCRVGSIDRKVHAVQLADGRIISYDWLVLATGSRARRFPGVAVDGAGVHELRTLSQAEALRKALRPEARVLIIGAGYIGLEAAASARARGASVTIIERESRVLARVASPAISAFFETHHRGHGVQFRLNSTIAAITPGSARGWAVSFNEGGVEEFDLILVGIGAQPNQELAVECGLRCEDGILVDEQTRTSDERILAIGDCSRRPLPLYQRVGRLESVANALEQARVAAYVIRDRQPPAHEVPWFWSDQYDLKLQIAGLSFDVKHHITRGDANCSHFAVFHLNDAEQLQAVEAVNAAPEFLAGRLLIASRKPVDPEALADPGKSMKEIAA